MNRAAEPRLVAARPRAGGYLLVLLVVIMAFVGVAAAMQVLILTSVGTTSRAYDSYRQSSTGSARLQRAVAEALLDQRQICVAPDHRSLAGAIAARLTDLAAGGEVVTATTIPTELPEIAIFPNSTRPADLLGPVPGDFAPLLTPELALLAGENVVAYPEMEFQFASTRRVLDNERSYRTRVDARLVAVPLTRFPIAAYDLPAEIGSDHAPAGAAAAAAMPAGLVPARDAAFVTTLQAHAGVLPYQYRRRAALAAAYQYVFSQAFIARVTEYAGITHFHDVDAAPGMTAALAGMNQAGPISSWDLGVAGSGTYGTVTMTRDAAVVFTESPGRILHLGDSTADAGRPPLFLMLLGPTDPKAGALIVDIANVARPVVIVGCNVRVTAGAGTSVNGALFLDPASALAPAGPISLGHLSYWAGSNLIAATGVTARPLAPAVMAIAPRVVYVATRASRL
jgi:hypothetical protein